MAHGDAAGRLIGRERQLDLLERALARRGSRAVALAGEPGIGKTALLRELVARAAARGSLVLTGSAAELEQELPFGAVSDALDAHVAALPDRVLTELGPDRLAELATVLPSLAVGGRSLGSALQVERFRAHRAVRVLLERLAVRPLVVALDDAHWADPASLELIAYLLRTPPRARVLLALSYRPAQAPAPFLEAVQGAAQARHAHVLELGPLTPAESELLLDGAFDAATRAELIRESGGNPFYLLQLARSTRRHERHLEAGPAEAAAAAPPSILGTIREELGELSPAARDLVGAAAVVGDPFERDVAAEVAGLGADAGAAVSELLDRDLVRETALASRLAFRHPIVRRAVYESGGPGWRLGAHARAAEALARRNAPVMPRAAHVERCAREGDEDALELLSEAGRLAAPRAPAAAAHWFGAALRILPAGADPGRRLGLLVPMATALGTAGRLEECRAALEEALTLLAPELTAVRARILAVIARVEHLLGQLDEARRRLERALAALPDRRSAEGAELLHQLAVSEWFGGRWDDMARLAHEAHSIATATGDELLAVCTGGLLALGEYDRGEIARALERADAARAVLDALPDERVAQRLDTLFFVGHVEYGCERFAAAAGHLRRGVAISRATGVGDLFVPFVAGLAVAELWQGHLEAAGELGEEALDAASLLGLPPYLMWAHSLRCWIATVSGDLQLALDSGSRATAIARRVTGGPFRWLAHAGLGAAWIEAGEVERGRAELLTAGGLGLDDVPRSFRTRWFASLALGEIARGRLDDAEQWVVRAERSSRPLGLHGREGDALRARAALLLARDRPDEALERARQAVVRYERAAIPVEGALARALSARALVALGERDQGAGELEAAHAAFAASGAVRSRDQAAFELRRLGRRVPRPGERRSAGNGLGALSARELEVAELVARGLTNRAIAAELFLSEKTVDTHLTHVFRKLGVSSRTTVAATVERARERPVSD
jgi:DNA-binding NarL/FixJ family response regulator